MNQNPETMTMEKRIMPQFYHLNIGQAELDEQRALLERLVGLVHAKQTATIEPTDEIAVDAIIGLQNLLDAIADQTDN